MVDGFRQDVYSKKKEQNSAGKEWYFHEKKFADHGHPFIERNQMHDTGAALPAWGQAPLRTTVGGTLRRTAAHHTQRPESSFAGSDHCGQAPQRLLCGSRPNPSILP